MTPGSGRTLSLITILAPLFSAGMWFRKILMQYLSDQLWGSIGRSKICSLGRLLRQEVVRHKLDPAGDVGRDGALGRLDHGLQILSDKFYIRVLAGKCNRHEALRAADLFQSINRNFSFTGRCRSWQLTSTTRPFPWSPQG